MEMEALWLQWRARAINKERKKEEGRGREKSVALRFSLMGIEECRDALFGLTDLLPVRRHDL